MNYIRMTRKTDKGYVIGNYSECNGDLKIAVDQLGKLEDLIESGELKFQKNDKPCWAVVNYRKGMAGESLVGGWYVEKARIHEEKENGDVSFWTCGGVLLVTRKNFIFDTEKEANNKLEELKSELKKWLEK